MKYWMCVLIVAGTIGIIFLLWLFFDWMKYDAPEWVEMVFYMLCAVFMFSLLLYKIVGWIQ